MLLNEKNLRIIVTSAIVFLTINVAISAATDNNKQPRLRASTRPVTLRPPDIQIDDNNNLSSTLKCEPTTNLSSADLTFFWLVKIAKINPQVYVDRQQYELAVYDKIENEKFEKLDSYKTMIYKDQIKLESSGQSLKIYHQKFFSQFVTCAISLGSQIVLSDEKRLFYTGPPGDHSLILSHPKDQLNVAEGDSTYFKCELFSKDTQIHWIKDGEPLDENKRYIGRDTNFLQIIRVELGDQGNYSCVVNVTNRAVSSLSARLLVSKKVLNAHWILTPPSSVAVKRGDDVIIDCLAFYTETEATIYRLITDLAEDDVLCHSSDLSCSSDKFKMQNGRLIIRNLDEISSYILIPIREEDKEKYVLDIISEKNAIEPKTFNFRIISKPNLLITRNKEEQKDTVFFEQSLQYFNFSDSFAFNLTCISDIDEGNPPVWYQNGERIETTSVYEENEERKVRKKQYQGPTGSLLTIHNISESDQGLYQCFQSTRYGSSSNSINLIMKETLTIDPVNDFQLSLQTGNTLKVTWKAPQEEGTYHFSIFARTQVQIEDSDDVTTHQSYGIGECDEDTCMATISDLQPFATYHVTIRTELRFKGDLFNSVESKDQIIVTEGCAPNVVANNVKLGNQAGLRINQTALLVAWKFPSYMRRCGNFTFYHFITGYDLELAEEHFELAAIPEMEPKSLEDKIVADRNHFVVFHDLKPGHQFWFAIRPETKQGFIEYKPIYNSKHSHDDVITYDVKSEYSAGPDSNCSNNVTVIGLSCRFSVINESDFLDCDWTKLAKEDDSQSIAFRVFSFRKDFMVETFVENSKQKLLVKIPDIWDAYVINGIVHNCEVIKDVYFREKNLRRNKDRVNWRDVEVTMTSLALTWTYQPREVDRNRKLKYYEIRYHRVAPLVDQIDDMRIIQSRKSSLKMVDLIPGTKYRIQLKAIFDDQLPEKYFLLPAHIVHTLCPNVTAEKPANLSLAKVEGRNRYLVTWNKPSESEQQITKYQVLFQSPLHQATKLINFEDVAKKDSYWIFYLLPNTTYSVTIEARNCYDEFSSPSIAVIFTTPIPKRRNSYIVMLSVTSPTPPSMRRIPEVTPERKIKGLSNMKLILSTILPCVIVFLIFFIIWKFIGKTRGRSLVHKSFLCTECGSETKRPNSIPTSDHRDGNYSNGYIQISKPIQLNNDDITSVQGDLLKRPVDQLFDTTTDESGRIELNSSNKNVLNLATFKVWKGKALSPHINCDLENDLKNPDLHQMLQQDLRETKYENFETVLSYSQPSRPIPRHSFQQHHLLPQNEEEEEPLMVEKV